MLLVDFSISASDNWPLTKQNKMAQEKKTKNWKFPERIFWPISKQLKAGHSVSRRFFLKIPTFEPKNHENLELKNTPKITKITSKRPQNRGKITEKVLVWIYFWFFVTEMITFWAKLEDFPNFLGNFPKSRTFRGSWLVTEQKFLSRGSSSKSRILW